MGAGWQRWWLDSADVRLRAEQTRLDATRVVPVLTLDWVPINRYNEPCVPYPEDATYKTIALRCPRCDSWGCWRRYLSWEKSLGIMLNVDEHPAEVDEDHRQALARTLARVERDRDS